MIKSLTVTNREGDSIKLELAKPDKTGFLVKSVDGLGPVKANINTTKVAMRNGVSYNSSYMGQRDIIINLAFLQTETESIEDLRHKSYRYFPINTQIKIMIETDTRTCETTGYVEDNVPNIFSNNEGCTITVLCESPFLYSTEKTHTFFSALKPSFEFPFSNELYDSDGNALAPQLEMSEVITKSSGSIFYNGDYETGCIIKLHAIGDVSNITLHGGVYEQMVIDTTKLPLITGARRTYVNKFGDWTPGGYYSSNDQFSSNPLGDYKYITSDYIRTTPKSIVRINNLSWDYSYSSKMNRITYFDINKNVVEGITDLTSNCNTTVPDGVAYFRFTHLGETFDDAGSFIHDMVSPPCLMHGDTVTINTNVQHKSITLSRGGIENNIFNCLARDTKWFTITKGSNNFAYTAETGSPNLQVEIISDIVYEGV